MVTARGKDLKAIPLIPNGVTTRKSLEKALAAFGELPAIERQPDKLDVGGKEVGVKGAPPEPPADALIVRLFSRQFGRTEKGALRSTVPEDYDPKMRGFAARYAEPGNDFMWVPANEWKKLVPANGKQGDRFSAPPAFALRLFRYHLDPARGLGENRNFQDTAASAGQLTLTVEEVSDGQVKLRLEGSVKLLQKRGPEEVKWLRYEPSLLGYLTFGKNKQTVTRFDLIALGEVTGRPTGENMHGYRPGAQPLGIAFELVHNPSKAERLAPRPARDNLPAYLEPGNLDK